MKIPLPKTLRGSFSPTIIANYAVGIGVFEYPTGKPRPVISAIWTAINVLIHLSLVALADFEQLSRIQGSSSVTKNYRNGLYICIIIIAISLCISQIKSKMLKRSFSKLYYINERLGKLGVPNDCDMLFKAQLVYYITGFAYMITATVMDYIHLPIDLPTKFASVILFIAMHLWLIFTFIIDSSWIIIFGYFCNRFQHLNSLLVEQDLHKILDKLSSQESINRDLEYSLTLREIHGNLPSNRPTGWQGMLQIVRETRKLHRDLCSTTTELNSALGIQTRLSLALSTYLVVALLYNGYILLLGLIEIPQFHAVILGLVLWIVFASVKVFLLIHTGEKIKCEGIAFNVIICVYFGSYSFFFVQAHKAGQLIHTLLNSTIIYNQDVRNELKIFSLQLMQKPLELTASGFVIVDHRLAYSMTGAIFTYLIVLIQMRSIYEP